MPNQTVGRRAPTGAAVGDSWFYTDTSVWHTWDGTRWVPPTGGTAPNGGPNQVGSGYTYTTGAGGSGNTNGGDFTLNFGVGVGSGRAGGLIVNGQIGIGVNPDPNYDIYATPTANGSATRMGIRVDPTWTDAGNNATSYAFSTNTTLLFTGDANSGIATSGYYSQVTTPANAFNVGAVHGYKSLLQFSGSGVGLASSTLTAFVSATTILSTATGNPNELAGCHMDANHYGTGTVPLTFGLLGRVQLGDGNAKAADGNLTSVKVVYAESYLLGIGVTPGVATIWYSFFAEAPNFGSNNATSKATTFWGVFAEAPFNTYGFTNTAGGFTAGGAQISIGKQGGNTSGTNSNYGLQILGVGGTSASGGTVNNRSLDITLPSSVGVSGGTNSNIGAYIQGNGGTGAGTVNNWSLRNDSTAMSSFMGRVLIGNNALANGVTNSLTMFTGWDLVPTGATTSQIVGFVMIAGAAGAPTGVPTNASGVRIPLYYDVTNNFLYVYNGGWKKSTVYA